MVIFPFSGLNVHALFTLSVFIYNSTNHVLNFFSFVSPGHYYFWILDDVINNGFWCRHRGNLFVTLIWALADIVLYPGCQRFFSRAAGIFGVGRSHERRHYKDLTETENRARKVSGTQGNTPQFYSMKPWEIKGKEWQQAIQYNKRIGNSFGCDWREKFCKKSKAKGFLQGRRLRSRLS